jgi:beta-glucanase (GH16 family)
MVDPPRLAGYHAGVRALLWLATGVLALAPAWPSGDGPRAAAGAADLFFDDFSGPSLDRTKWNVVVTGRTVNNEQQAYVDSPETIALLPGDVEGASKGALAIRPRFRPGFTTPEGRRFDFISGRIDTRGRFAFTHGTASARIRLKAGAGLWPAFWILGTGRWPATGEIDVMEHVGEPFTSVAIHGPGYSGNTPLVHRTPFDDPGGVEAWHVYAVDWSAAALAFSIDGREVYRATRSTIEQYGPWAFDNDKFLILNVALGGGYPHSVNHADAPYFGLPASTVDLIKAGGVQVLIDWVRVVSSEPGGRGEGDG